MGERIGKCVHDVPMNEECRACALDAERLSGYGAMPRSVTPSRFMPRAVDERQASTISGLRIAYEALEAAIVQRVPAGRERSIALTELESSCMWAVKGITHGGPNG